MTLLAAGDMPAFEQLATAMLFSPRVSREFEPAVIVEDDIDFGPVEPLPAARGVRHRRRQAPRA